MQSQSQFRSNSTDDGNVFERSSEPQTNRPYGFMQRQTPQTIEGAETITRQVIGDCFVVHLLCELKYVDTTYLDIGY